MTDQKKKVAIIVTAVVLAVVLVIGLVVQLTKKDTPPVDETPVSDVETGTYYFDAGIQEYTLVLNEDKTFNLSMKETYSGTYTLIEGTLTLDFNAEGKESVTATLADNVVTFTYEEAAYRFLKKINFTVSFESNQGSAVEAQTVINGKTAAKPADPTRDGHLFIGWYADSEFKTPFEFGSQPVTADTTVYARWTEKTLGDVEYKVEFNVNCDGVTAPEAVITRGGKLFELPALTREGYTFNGWWVSMTDSADKLSYRYDEGMALSADTTLYALWESNDLGGKLAAPVVNISAGVISWNAVENARSYTVTITEPDGTVLTPDASGTTINHTFVEEGEYVIKVVANANSGEANNSEAVRYYTHNMLGRVYLFDVIDGNILVYNSVENAEKYVITVSCGNSAHKHTELDNGNSKYFSFANCEMAEGGIKFVVKAMADGYATSVSKEFVFERTLGAIEGLRYDEATQTVAWNDVLNATEYMVSVQCGNAAHNHDFVSNGSKNSVCLKECDALEGGIIVKVYPKTRGYNSPAASEIKAVKNTIASPSGLSVNGTVLSWNAVAGATKYEVTVGNVKLEATEATCDIAEALSDVDGAEYAISVVAVGETTSLASDVLNTCYNALKNDISYSNGQVFWTTVLGADSYEIQVNDGEVVSVPAGAASAAVKLTKSGSNVVKVRFTDGAIRSEWVSVEVYAYTVIYDSQGGNYIAEQYKAAGDAIDLPVTIKKGYTFAAWYNVPGGSASNGKVYLAGTTANASPMVLYAYYNPNKYTVTYNYGEGGTGEATTGDVYYEQNYQLAVPVLNNATASFGGWFSAPYGYGVQYTDAKGNSLAPWSVAEDAELYAFYIDDALEMVQTKVNGKDSYMVTAGDRIALLEEVTIPATYNGLPVLTIAGNAFKNCTNLKVINIPASIETISSLDPFEGCTALEAVNVYAVEGTNNARYWSMDGVLFDNGIDGTKPVILEMPMAKTGTYRIPANINEIAEGVFAGSSLNKIIVPSSVTKIGKEAFANSTKLTAVIFESAVGEQALTIGARAFAGCTALDKITLPARLDSIELTKYVLVAGSVDTSDVNNVFAGCTALNEILVASGNKNLKSVDGVLYSADGKTLVYCPATKSGVFEIPAGVNAIAPGAFVGCNAITEVKIANTVNLIGECAFYGLEDKLEKVTFAGNAINTSMIIDDYAFAGCADLTEVVFESGSKVATISKGAFQGCEYLESFTIPASVSSIEADAFRGCKRLKTLTFAENGNELKFGENAFSECEALESVTLPANVSEIPGIFSGCTSLKEVNVSEDNKYLVSIDGVIFNKAKTELLFFPVGRTGEYAVPESVTTINDGVFYGVKLDKLTIYNSVAVIGDSVFQNSTIGELVFAAPTEATAATALTIGDYAFYGAYINTVTLPAHTVSIGEWSFAQTKYRMKNVVLNEGLTTIGANAFNSSGISSVNIPSTVKEIPTSAFESSNIYSIDIAEGVEVIGDKAFQSSYIDSVTVPASVTMIGTYAFYGSDLTTITFAPNSSLKTIGAHAFDDAYYLKGITIPKSVTEIGAYAFANNYSYFKELKFEEGGTEPLVLGTTPFANTYYDWSSGSYITEYERGHVFSGCNKIYEINLPSRLVEIGEYSFNQVGSGSVYDYNTWSYTYPGLTLSFGENSQLTTIGEGAFKDSGLKGELVIPKSVRNMDPVTDSVAPYNRLGIGAQAFYSNDALTKVSFEAGTDAPITIGDSAFAGCFTNKDTYYGIPEDRGITELTLPARLASYTAYDGTVIEPLDGGAAVFSGCRLLTNIFVDDGVDMLYADYEGVLYKTTGKDTVNGETRTPVYAELVACPAGRIETVNVPATVTKVHSKAFYECRYLTEVVFNVGTSDMTIGDDVFYRCDALTSIVLPDNVVSLGREVFAQCEALTSLTLSKKLTKFDSSMVEYCDKLAEIKVSADGIGDNYSSANGVLYNADKTELIMYPSACTAESFTVPSTVKVIGNAAFMNNGSIKTIVLPAGLEKIGDQAFSGCSKLTTVNVPNTVTYVGAKAFYSCKALTSVVFEEKGTALMVMGEQAFYNTTSLVAIKLPARLAALGDLTFNNSGLASIEFEDNSQLKTLGSSVFAGTSFVTLTLPNGIVSIGDNTFFNATKLERVTFGEGLESMGFGTFASCTALKEVNFPASLKTMGINTFYYEGSACSNLTNVTFASGSQLKSIPSGTFAHTAIVGIEIPASVLAIDDRNTDEDSDENPGAFAGCTALERVSFEVGTMCANIGDHAFNGCTKLASFEIPTRVNRLGDSSFKYCESLKSIVIPETCTTFGNEVFYGAYNLSEVEFNANATALGSYMFYQTAITSFEIPTTVTSIGNACFDGTALKEITVPASVNMMGWSVFARCEDLETVTILGSLKEIPTTAFENSTKLSTVILPSSIEAIREDAFAGCTSLTTITLPASLNTLESAFVGSGLAAYMLEEGNTNYSVSDGVLFNADKTKILSYPVNKPSTSFTIPKEVTEIGASTFAGITVLKNVYFEEGGTDKLVIGDGAFAGCTGLIYMELPERLTSIGYRAFYNCSSMVYVVLPSTLDEIGEEAFYECNVLREVGNFSDLEINFEEAPGDLDYYMMYYYDAEGGHMLDVENSSYYDIIVVDYPGEKSRTTIDANGFATLKYIDNRIFLVGYNGDSTDITIPNTVTDIYAYAMTNCTASKVTISDSVRNIFGYAFNENENLVELHLNANLEFVEEYAFYRCGNLTTVMIPAGIDEMDYSVFSGCYSAVIYVAEESCPDAWASSFYGGAKLVIWGYNGEEHTYTFMSDGKVYETITSDGAISLPANPVKTDYIFLGWYDNEEFTGKAISGPYYNSNGGTFYARWLTQDEFDALYAGTSREYAIDITLGETYTATYAEPGEYVWFKYTIESTGKYHVYMESVDGGRGRIEYYTSIDDTYYYDYEQMSYGQTVLDRTFYSTWYEGDTYYIAIRSYSSYDCPRTYNFVITAA